MKKVLRVLGGLVMGLFVIILLAFVFISLRGIPSYDVAEIEFIADPSPEALERGHVLTMTLCANCHRNKNSGELTGTRMYDVPEEFGTIYSPNITQDKRFGIGDWTDGELLRLLRTGIKKNGEYAPPYMAKLPNMSDKDINAIIAFLRSDHELVKARPIADTECKPSFLTKFLCTIEMKPFPMPDRPIPHPDPSDKIAHGRYLAVNLDCFSCHSADFKTNDYLIPENSAGYFGGGNPTLDMEGNVIHTSNLTPDKTSGIGKWTEDAFVNAVKYGQLEGKDALRYPMTPFVHLSDAEIEAIYNYLMTIPPINNEY